MNNNKQISKLINFNGRMIMTTGTIIQDNLETGYLVDFTWNNIQYKGIWKI